MIQVRLRYLHKIIFLFQNHPAIQPNTLYLFILLLVPAFSNCESHPEPSYGFNLPHGSITFYGPDFGDNRRIELPEFETSTRSSFNFVTSFKPSFSHNYGQWTPITQSPNTFFSPYPPVSTTARPKIQSNDPSYFSLTYSTDQKQPNTRLDVKNPSLTAYTQGPVNSAVPITLFYPEFPTTTPRTSTSYRTTTTTRTTASSTTTKRTTTTPASTTESSIFKLNFDFSSFGKSKEESKIVEPELASIRRISFDETSSINIPETTLDNIYLSKTVKKGSVNDIPLLSDSRKTRKVDFSSPSGKNITALIQKALKLFSQALVLSG